MYPNGEFKSDSTPIMLELESLYSRRSIIPPSPSIAFIARLIEDMADECMPFPMFYFRWTTDADWCGRRLMIGWNGALADQELNRISGAFIKRQQSQLGAAAQFPVKEVQKNLELILEALEGGLKKSLFFFGTRPSIAEFGLFGQLSQYVVDPYISSITKKQAEEIAKQKMNDLNAIDLNVGEIVWQIPLGEYDELTKLGFPKTGTENYGGPIVTAGGLIFIGASNDEYFRAFDKISGEELWRTELPAGGYATPITYQIDFAPTSSDTIPSGNPTNEVP